MVQSPKGYWEQHVIPDKEKMGGGITKKYDKLSKRQGVDKIRLNLGKQWKNLKRKKSEKVGKNQEGSRTLNLVTDITMLSMKLHNL